MKKIYYVLAIILAFVLFPSKTYANTISDIDMSIYVNSNGTATITEKWTATVDQGTEGYKPYYNLGNSEVTNFKVSEGTTTYTNVGTWDLSASFEEKAYKNGLNYISNGIELCWGISKYGSHTYTLSYNITNFITEVSDSQILYWTLIPYDLSAKPDNVHIKIYSDFKYEDTLDVWGYGNYGGTAYVYDGYIEMTSEGALDSSEYMTILVKYPLGTFTTTNKDTSHDFNYYYTMAEEGSTDYTGDGSDLPKGVEVFTNIFKFLFFGSIIVGIIFLNKKAMGIAVLGKYTLNFGKQGKDLGKEIPNYRDIPCNKNIYDGYFISRAFNLTKNKTDLLGAVLLKWLKEDKITTKKVITGILKKEVLAIDLKDSKFDNSIEQELYDMMKEASEDGVLEQKEFEKWCRNNYADIIKWFDDVLNNSGKGFDERKYITKEENRAHKYTVNPEFYEEGKKLKGLNNFLIEFSRIGEKTPIEVKLWEEYLMFAQIFGIAKEVAKQFKELYPDMIDQQSNYNYDTFIFINTISNSGMQSANSAKARAESYSSGGGGFSSGGGGGGSFGGGGGGGGFR